MQNNTTNSITALLKKKFHKVYIIERISRGKMLFPSSLISFNYTKKYLPETQLKKLIPGIKLQEKVPNNENIKFDSNLNETSFYNFLFHERRN
ncbi:hypothetical protein [Emticicia sp. TH156]|uniref:hypothetical protein n=1 Tax=Emticicia sp. TH156 TaxID=2067454 RepID=UPI000CC0135C|nr:hypothetical protein [Emticicia sp. TH156]PLK44565.1 hypothetical protein C0V77_08825 [Emticicia sp. TH156]